MSQQTEERGELIGQVLDGRYRIGRRIGLGGTGVVFEALCLADHSVVAIKTLRPCFVTHPDLGRRLRREAEIARRVRHPGIVPVLDEGTLRDASPFIVMPLLTGESLSRLLLRLGTLDFATVAGIAGRVAAILHSAHCAGYVHRDVKPEHVLLERSPSGELLVYLLDFGVCSAREAPAEERTREKGKVFGTPSYVSPEQASGECDVDGRADLFSVGVLMFEALVGHVPFTASTVSKLLLRIIQEDAPRVSHALADVEPAIDDIVARLMARDKEDRFPSARALSRALAAHVPNRVHVEHTLAGMVRTSNRSADRETDTALPAQQVA